jgi:hypothetical protein
MKFKIMSCALVLALGGLAFARPGQQDEENVRGAFLTSRPKERPPTPPASTKPVRHPPKSSSTTASAGPKSTDPSANPDTTGAMMVTDPKSNNSARITAPKMGLGLTLFTRDANGLAVRVDPSHEFHKGDRVRILLETNADGYLYIFNTTDGGSPVMIYPSPELDEGGNYIQSHVPFEIPSSVGSEERLKWFSFDQYAGTERLYFVFTRERLSGVPIDNDLIAYCRESKTRCPVKPSAQLWSQFQKQMNQPLKTARSQKYGRAQTSGEEVSTTRGIGLSQEDPEPSVIMMSVSINSNTLVTLLELVHR